jgi:hypothetical protein
VAGCTIGKEEPGCYALRTSQTTTKIIKMVPTIPYPNMMISLESKILGRNIPMTQLAALFPLEMPPSAQNPENSGPAAGTGPRLRSPNS